MAEPRCDDPLTPEVAEVEEEEAAGDPPADAEAPPLVDALTFRIEERSARATRTRR